jgi:hypothetical protein
LKTVQRSFEERAEMSGMSLASREQLVEDVRQLISELEHLKVALTLLGRDIQVEALEGAIEGTRGMLDKIRSVQH